MTGNTDNPHDRYFKETFSQPAILAMLAAAIPNIVS